MEMEDPGAANCVTLGSYEGVTSSDRCVYQSDEENWNEGVVSPTFLEPS